MVKLPRDFKNDLLLELRNFARCKLKRKDPNHFCSNREFQKNLKMSARDVGKTLHNLVEQRKIKHERNVLYNGKLRDRFTIIDPRMYTPAEIIVEFRKNVTRQLQEIEALTKKMKKTPALYDVKEEKIPIPMPEVFKKKTKTVNQVATSRHGKMNKKGYQYLEDFCNLVNRAFSYVDSLGYSQFAINSETNLYDLSEKVLVAGAIPKGDKYDKMISDLRFIVFNQIKGCIANVLQDLPALQKRAIHETITLRIPIIYQTIQLKRYADLKG